jgi:pimeloyl-ACP methyl ester carboxylesterase
LPIGILLVAWLIATGPASAVTAHRCGATKRASHIRVSGIACRGGRRLAERVEVRGGPPRGWSCRHIHRNPLDLRCRRGHQTVSWRVRRRAGAIESIPVSFSVKNTDTSGLPCPTDGKQYVVHGELIGPPWRLGAATDTADRAVTLYLHGLGFGGYFWNYAAVSGYDYAVEMAKLGHASAVIDRLGYGSSSHPDGSFSCVGGQADITHQIIDQLKAGSYATSGPSVRFERVALASHSAGGAIAQVEAYSYRDTDALIVMAWDDQPSLLATDQALQTGVVCATTGQLAGPGQPGGYAYFGQTPGAFRAAMFHNADPRVEASITGMRPRDPCGEIASLATAIIQGSKVAAITEPVLVVCGANDALFPPPSCERQQALYTGSHDVSTTTLQNTGHALTLGRTAPQLRAAVSAWLDKRGF